MRSTGTTRITTWREPSPAVRKGDHKLIGFFEGGRLEVCSFADDIGETTNPVARMPARAAAMRRMLADSRKSVGVDARVPDMR
jgi:hypothetical protein